MMIWMFANISEHLVLILICSYEKHWRESEDGKRWAKATVEVFQHFLKWVMKVTFKKVQHMSNMWSLMSNIKNAYITSRRNIRRKCKIIIWTKKKNSHLKFKNKNPDIIESYVLLCEVRWFITFPHPTFMFIYCSYVFLISPM